MPLKLGGIETERPQTITWDVNDENQIEDSIFRLNNLVKQGFTIIHSCPGEIRLFPPKKDPDIGVFRILSQNGDDRLIWDRTKKQQIKEAYAKFNELIQKGYKAYATLSDGKRGHSIDSFDPFLEEILFVPAVVPG